MADSSKLDALMMLMALKAMESDLKGKSISPFTISIEVTATSISCKSEGNKKLIEDIGGQEWLKETQEKIAPIMSEQTTKFAELMGKKFGFSFSKDSQKDGGDPIDEFLKGFFRGGGD
ncbi:MAG: hypothetical protein NC548_57385 [Lachnospiraceae bacterium]|nr:hypothetical protein [Lachnospiraceae bacterium]